MCMYVHGGSEPASPQESWGEERRSQNVGEDEESSEKKIELTVAEK